MRVNYPEHAERRNRVIIHKHTAFHKRRGVALVPSARSYPSRFATPYLSNMGRARYERKRPPASGWRDGRVRVISPFPLPLFRLPLIVCSDPWGCARIFIECKKRHETHPSRRSIASSRRPATRFHDDVVVVVFLGS